MNSIDELIARARAFRSGPFEQQMPLYRRLVREGQSPKIMMIACADSRVDPSIIFDAEPGQIFMVRNVASLVPPSTPDDNCHGTSAALEFAVTELGVEHVIVLGHGHCGGIKALLNGADREAGTTDFIGPWLASAAESRDQVLKDAADASAEEQARALEYESVRQSVRNLMTYSWVAERVNAGSLSLHGWHIDIADGTLSAVSEDGAPEVISH